jgi:hypothetical protein
VSGPSFLLSFWRRKVFGTRFGCESQWIECLELKLVIEGWVRRGQVIVRALEQNRESVSRRWIFWLRSLAWKRMLLGGGTAVIEVMATGYFRGQKGF